MLKIGDKGDAVKALQEALNKKGYKLSIDGDFEQGTSDAVHSFQFDNKLEVDGIVGPQTLAKLGISVPPATIDNSSTPWMDWMKKEAGGSENDPVFDKFMSKFWRFCDLNYTTIKGSNHAWCALTANAALHETGYKGTGSAAAASFQKYGTACAYKYGALIPITHHDGSHHITFFESWYDEKAKIANCIGGNQSDMLKVTKFNLSGPPRDTCTGPRWPVK